MKLLLCLPLSKKVLPLQLNRYQCDLITCTIIGVLTFAVSASTAFVAVKPHLVEVRYCDFLKFNIAEVSQIFSCVNIQKFTYLDIHRFTNVFTLSHIYI